MDLFDVVNLEVPTSVNVTVRAREGNERPILEATRGRLVDLVLPGADGGSSSAAAPIQQVPPQQEPVAEEEAIAEQEPVVEQAAPQFVDLDESEEKEGTPLERKRPPSDDGAESSKKARHEPKSEHSGDQ